ncbi:MAG: hypothetical protein QY331_07665 [Melioribacteraceae bacterium]|nr:MAG: hypothetical protein QY331_07665 [Melioribacteraceae bacterium]
MESKLKHLEMIQGIINRMAQNSFMLKGWSVIIISALFVLAAKDSVKEFVYLGYFPAVIFWVLDSYFLWQEKLFRKLYDKVRSISNEDIDFSMNTKEFLTEVSWFKTTFAKTPVLFHLMVLSVLIIVTIIINWR